MSETNPIENKEIYNRQNRAIHKDRTQLCMSLDDCRELAKEISGMASISSLDLRKRWELIEILKSKGARVINPKIQMFQSSQHERLEKSPDSSCSSEISTPDQSPCSIDGQKRPGDVYPDFLDYWNKRFPKRRPGYASNRQLALIQTLFTLDFNDGRAGTAQKGLRGLIFRQTKPLEGGPVSALEFLRDNHVQAVLMPLKKKEKEKQEVRPWAHKGARQKEVTE